LHRPIETTAVKELVLFRQPDRIMVTPSRPLAAFELDGETLSSRLTGS